MWLNYKIYKIFINNNMALSLQQASYNALSTVIETSGDANQRQVAFEILLQVVLMNSQSDDQFTTTINYLNDAISSGGPNLVGLATTRLSDLTS